MGESPERIFRLAKTNLKRVIGTSELFAVGYGDVGSSIYYALGATALFALGATPIALLIAGIVFICTGLTYAELTTAFPEPGGSATFARHAFNDLISFIAGWGLLLDYIVTMSIAVFTIPPYFKHFLELFNISYQNTPIVHLSSTISLIIVLFFVNLIGLRYSGWVSFLLALFCFVVQAGIVIVGGLFLLNFPYVFDHMRIGVSGVSWSPDWWEFLKGTAIAMVAYTGIEAISQLAAETKNPEIAVPRAIKWTIVVVLFLYFGISAVGLSVISPQELGIRYIENPILGIVLNFPVGGKLLAPWVGLIAAIVLLIAANAGMIGCSRLAFSMGKFYQVPNILYKLHPRYRTPYVSLGVFAILSIIIVILSRNQMIFFVDLYNFGAQIAFFSAHLSLIILRYKQPSLHRPYKAPFNLPIGKQRFIPVPAVIGAIASFCVWMLVVFTKPEGRTMGLLWIVLGTSMYFYYRRKKKIGATSQLQVEEIEIPEYKPMQIKNILVAARFTGGTDALQMAFQIAKHHNAKVTAVYVLEVPISVPMDVQMMQREKMGEEALKRAEAVAREYHLSLELELVRSRSIEEALIEFSETGNFDLIVVGAGRGEIWTNFASQAEKLLKHAKCRIIFCKS